jgi:hypothetical protein
MASATFVLKLLLLRHSTCAILATLSVTRGVEHGQTDSISYKSDGKNVRNVTNEIGLSNWIGNTYLLTHCGIFLALT